MSIFRPLLFCSSNSKLSSLFCTERNIVPSIFTPFHLAKDSSLKSLHPTLISLFSHLLTLTLTSQQANLLYVLPFLDAKMILQNGTGRDVFACLLESCHAWEIGIFLFVTRESAG